MNFSSFVRRRFFQVDVKLRQNSRVARQNRQDCVECFVNLRQNRSKMTKNSIHIYIYCLIFSCNTVIKLLDAAPKSCAKFCLR